MTKTIETRAEAADRAKARFATTKDPADLHEVVRKGDTFQSAAGDTLHRGDAITENDVREVEYGEGDKIISAGPWRPAADRAKLSG